jgi:exodeoxyribonuclease III
MMAQLNHQSTHQLQPIKKVCGIKRRLHDDNDKDDDHDDDGDRKDKTLKTESHPSTLKKFVHGVMHEKNICVSWNVAGMSNDKWQFIKEYLNRVRPIVFCINETKEREQQLAKWFSQVSTEYDYIINSHEPCRYHGVAMLVRKDISYQRLPTKYLKMNPMTASIEADRPTLARSAQEESQMKLLSASSETDITSATSCEDSVCKPRTDSKHQDASKGRLIAIRISVPRNIPSSYSSVSSSLAVLNDVTSKIVANDKTIKTVAAVSSECKINLLSTSSDVDRTPLRPAQGPQINSDVKICDAEASSAPYNTSLSSSTASPSIAAAAAVTSIHPLAASSETDKTLLRSAQESQMNIVASYVPNAGRGLKHIRYRLDEWDKHLQNYLNQVQKTGPTLWIGDLNVAPEDIDVSEPKKMKKYPGFTVEERKNFTHFIQISKWIDTWRKSHPKQKEYTWRGAKTGMRLDHVIASKDAEQYISDSFIDTKNPKYLLLSDHLPVGVCLL